MKNLEDPNRPKQRAALKKLFNFPFPRLIPSDKILLCLWNKFFFQTDIHTFTDIHTYTDIFFQSASSSSYFQFQKSWDL